MALTSGTKLGPYEIQSLLGAGGMGEVYRAKDTRLGREVAIKVLPVHLSASPELRERFEREARAISSLNHERICTLHDVGHQEGVDFLVMEYLEGESLAERLRKGALPLKETVKIGMEVCEALDVAHRAGIVHRDLKPGNIMLTRNGSKLMDFGLAKASVASRGESGNAPLLSAAATMSGASPLSPLTTAGHVMGTIQYMSPEQIEGKEADARSDIFALGAVLYEMAAGKRPFEGKSQISVASAILEKEPEAISVFQPLTPPSFERAVAACLAKNPDERFQSAVDLKRELKWVGEAPIATTVAAPRTHWREWAWALFAGVAVAITFWVISTRPSNQKPALAHLSIALAPGAISTTDRFNDKFAISPDGNWIVYVVTRGGRQQLFLRALRESEGKPIDDTDDADQPFVSPDSLWIAFISGGTLKKVPVSGGSSIAICSLASTPGGGATGFIGGAWRSDNTIAFVPQFNAGIWTVSANGGTPQLLLSTNPEKDRVAFIDLQALPGNKGILFSLVPGRAMKAAEEDIAVLETGAAEPRILIRGGSNGRYARTGHLLYARGGVLLAVPFNLSRLVVTGTPVSVMDGLETNPVGGSPYAVSENGTLLYEPSTGLKSGEKLALVDRKGHVRPITDGSSYPQEFSLSPDNRSIAADVVAVNNDIWTYDVTHGTPLRLTFEPGDEVFPQWTADGKRIAFGTRTGKMFWKLADGSGEREEISRSEYPRYPSSFSPDGKTLAFVEIHPSRQRDIWLMSLDGDRKAQTFQATDADEWAPKFSPDGHRIAYTSNETGRNEVYVRPIGSPGGRKQISTDGGTSPAWARNGRELFFLKGDKLAAVTLDAENDPAGQSRVVLDAAKLADFQFDANSPWYDVMPDGEHFVMLLSPQHPSPTHYNIVVNWFEELNQLVPTR